jgi:peptide/nickel transport system permease protein
MNLRRFLLRKAVTVVITIFLIISLDFFLFQVMPGDPTRVLLPRGSGCSNATGACVLRAQLLKTWGYDQPIVKRYIIYLQNLLHGNLGTTITYQGGGAPVIAVIAPRLQSTLILVGIATVATMWLGLILGRVSGWRRGRRADILIMMSTLSGYSMPTFWVCILLVSAFAVSIPLFPVSGEHASTYMTLDWVSQQFDYFWHLILPILAFVINNVAWFSLTLRNSLTDVLPQDFMVTVAAKGLTEQQQLKWHALPNARLPVVTAAALYFGWVVSGAIMVETVFNITGIGQLTWYAATTQDFPLLSGIFLVITLGVVIANASADVLYFYLDPRIRER